METVKSLQLKCCNCGGEQSVAYRGCAATRQKVVIQKMKVQSKYDTHKLQYKSYRVLGQGIQQGYVVEI